MGKGEVSWKGRTAEGGKREVYAHRESGDWKFFVREKRYDPWVENPEPPLDDWIELLDGVRRRIARRLLRPEEEGRVKRRIAESFPGEKIE